MDRVRGEAAQQYSIIVTEVEWVQVKCFYGVIIIDRKRWNGSEKSMMMIIKIVVTRI